MMTPAAYRPADFLAQLALPASRARLAAAHGGDAAAALALARHHATAIAADFSWPLAKAVERLLAGLFRRIFDGIEVRGLAAVRAAADEHATLVYLPCHRSHLDYLLLSHAIYRGGLTPPHIAAGDNMNMPLVGSLLRRGGGFFMRRRFKGDAFYAHVFALYLEGLLASGLPLAFFIEGGRSRSGAMLPPKSGLLGMLVDAFVRAPGRPVRLVPVFIGYEQLPQREAESFVRELAGQPKQRESLRDILAAAGLLRQPLGRPCLHFAAPLDLADWLDTQTTGWRSAAPASLRATTATLAAESVRRIAAAAVVNASHWVALAWPAGQPSVGLPRGQLAARIAALQQQLPDVARMDNLSPEDCIERALRLRVVGLRGDSVVADGVQAAQLDYFRNTIRHLLPADAKEP